ncbi:hypothetical protein EV126DRAFT_436609 [Verticillium dahliae]|nr:hypothetical protein EV126DRAFT_436609 [Verticillium dahliae]
MSKRQQITPLPLKPYDPERSAKVGSVQPPSFPSAGKTFLRRAHDLSQIVKPRCTLHRIQSPHMGLITSEPDQASFPPTRTRSFTTPKHDVVDSALSDGFETHVSDQ